MTARNRTYSWILGGCMLGYFWLFVHQWYLLPQKKHSTVCVIKSATDYPCPSCGSTRAMSAFFDGHFMQALALNPIGILGALAIIVFPVWILLDVLMKQRSFFTLYHRTEKFLGNKYVLIVVAVLMGANWIWNIHKGF